MLRQSRTPAAERRRAQPCPRAGGGDIGGRRPVSGSPLPVTLHRDREGKDLKRTVWWFRLDLPAKIFLSTSPVWGTTRAAAVLQTTRKGISIHVPRMGDDSTFSLLMLKHTCISIHVPRMGDDCGKGVREDYVMDFYPRPPYGGRLYLPRRSAQKQNFYPRPPYGGRRLSLLPFSS